MAESIKFDVPCTTDSPIYKTVFGRPPGTITVYCAHLSKPFRISASSADLSGNHRDEFESLYKANRTGSFSTGMVLTQWVIRPAIPFIAQMSSEPLKGVQSVTLAELLDEEIICLKLKNVDNSLVAVREGGRRISTLDQVTPLPLDCWSLTPSTVRAEDLTLTWDPRLESSPRQTHVFHDSKKYFFQSRFSQGKNFDHTSLLEEASILQEIANSPLADKIRVPKLHAFVQAGEESKFVGFITDFVDGLTLDIFLMAYKPAHALKADIMKQLEEQVKAINTTHVIPNLLPGFIVIDQENKVWLVDFGHPYKQTEWTDRDKQGTIEGNQQALERIRESLGL